MRIWTLRLVGVLLVLALGIAVGAGPLQKSNERRDDELAAQKGEVVAKERQLASLRKSAEYDEAYAAATAGGLVRGVLEGRSVTLLELPGAEDEAVAGLRAQIAEAGGRVTAEIDFASVMGKASSRQLVEALTSQMVSQNGLDVPDEAGGYQRFGLLLARAVAVPADEKRASAPYDGTSVGIVSGLQTAELIVARDVSARAGLTVAVTGPAAATAEDAAANAVPTTILRAYATRGPVVVAGPASAAGPLGIVGSLRSGDDVAGLSTVDTVEATAGQVTAVLALAALARGASGDWGGVDAEDGTVPPLR